jgi:hypothetical protein
MLKFFQLDLTGVNGLEDYFTAIRQLKIEAFYKTIKALENNEINPKSQPDKNLPPHGPMSLNELYEVHHNLKYER